jgi:hypothetical protein
MKKLTNYFFIAVAAMAMVFTSCTDDENATGPTITFKAIDGYLTGDATGDDALDVGDTARFSWEVIKGSANLEQFTIRDANSMNYQDYPKTNIDKDQYEDEDGWILQTEGDYKFTFIATDKDGLEDVVTFTVSAKGATTPLSSAQDFTWQRVGGANGTGLAEFGLSWTSNTSSVAIIKKDADKFVELDASDWTGLTTVEGLIAAIDAAVDQADFRGISVTASNSYDVVLGTKKGSDYFLIHITNATVTSDASGTTVTITGDYKE